MLGLTISKYRLLEEIGRGAMGLVFKARAEDSGEIVAVKILAEKLVSDPEMLARFEREGLAASDLHSPHICKVFEAGNWQGRPYIVMELLDGRPLDELLPGAPLPVTQVIRIGIGAASALEAAHAIGVVHRDIKPANLFLCASGEVKVLDFGLAKVQQPALSFSEDIPTVAMTTRQGMVVGTLAYMSPEQVCCEPIDGRADLFSLGVVLYELATGRLPVRSAINTENVPGRLGPVLAKVMSHEPERRYQTAGEFREALEQHAAFDREGAIGALRWAGKAFSGE